MVGGAIKPSKHIKIQVLLETLQQHAITCYQDGNDAKAIYFARKIVQQFPKHIIGWKILGNAFFRLENMQNALAAKRQAVRLAPDDDEALSNFSTALLYFGLLDEAEYVLVRAITLNPNNSAAYSNLCLVLTASGRLHEAIVYGRKAISKESESAKFYCDLSIPLHKLGLRKEAFNCLQTALNYAPYDFLVNKNFGIILTENGQYLEAKQALQRALLLKPNDAEVLCSLGVIKFKTEEFESAKEYYDRALAINPNCQLTQNSYGDLHQRLGQLPQAINCFRQVLVLRLKQASRIFDQPKQQSFDNDRHMVLLWQTLVQLAQAGVHAFVTSGVLLGLVRTGHLLPFDKDFDFGIPYTEHEAARACLVAHGWTAHMHNFGLINPRAYWHQKTGISLDVCGFTVEHATNITLGGFWLPNVPMGWNRISMFPTLNLHQVQSPAGMIWTLTDPESWLKALYGDDWRIPDPDFDTVIAAKNLRGFSLLTQCYAFSRIYYHWQRGALKKSLAITRHTLERSADDMLLQQVEQHLLQAINRHDHA